MGGGGIRKDPAIERWALMRDNTHLYFRLTPFTIGVGLVTLVGIPLALYYGIQKGEELSLKFTQRNATIPK